MDFKDLDPAALPKPVRDMMANVDPSALKSMLASMDGDQLKSLLAGAMGYVKNMSESEKEALKQLIKVKD